MKAHVSGAWTTTMHLCFAATFRLMAQSYWLVMRRDQWRYIRTCTCTHCTQYCRCGAYSFHLSIQIWSLTTKPGGRLLNDLALHVDWVNCVLYSPSGHHILSAGDNGIIKVRVKLITSDILWIDHVHTTCTSLDCSQILWNEDEDESEEFTKLNGPLVPHYHRRFTVHFAKNSSGYEPTIVCYIPKESRLQVNIHLLWEWY